MVELKKKPPVVEQFPAPGTSRVKYCGDTVTFTLRISFDTPGRAWVRTNLGTAGIARSEIINRVEKNEIRLDEAWYDLPMPQTDATHFNIRLPLHQTGFFQAKCFFIPEDSDVPVWPKGPNTVINVEPAGTCCANIIYNAFVRQFGRSKSGSAQEPGMVSLIEDLDAKGYTVIPESGKFRDLKQEVAFIFSRLGCRMLHLLPIHPTPTTYARMGRFGSPYAALNFTEVDPALAVFDPAATPLEQFMELVDTVHYYSGYIIMDIAINHTGWAASIHESNPQWLVREKNGEIQAPGAWGVVWADLTKLDYSHTDLWEYMADVFLLWCHRGVDGFRCDAGYMVPVRAWEYIIAKIRQEYPDVLFFLEGLGGPLETTQKLLSQANFNWAYSELFQNYSVDQISRYLPFVVKMSEESGHLIHYAETHDNNRLASVSHTYAKMRTSLCALFSICGGFGFANGVEWFASEKINVHESKSLNWGSRKNQVDHISRLVLILRRHPVFFSGARLAFIHEVNSRCLVLLRHHPEFDSRLLILVNLDCDRPQPAAWTSDNAGADPDVWYDLITGVQVTAQVADKVHSIRLNPGEVLALASDKKDLDQLEARPLPDRQAPERVLLQKRKALVLSILAAVNGYGDISGLDIEHQAELLAQNPVEFIRSLNRDSNESRVIIFDIETDTRRRIMIPPGFFLMVQSTGHFRAELLDPSGRVKKSLGYVEGLPLKQASRYAAVFNPLDIKNQSRDVVLHLRMFAPEKSSNVKAYVTYLASFDSLTLRMSFTRREIARHPSLKLLAATDKGAMMRAAASWGTLESRYDGLLGANLSADIPEDRWMVLARYRIWAIYQGYSRELSLDCLQAFWASHDRGGKWRFHVPTSEGRYYVIQLYLSMDKKDNRVRMIIQRESPARDTARQLEDRKSITLIVRPDIEDRSFHEPVKAFKGAETAWPKAVRPFETGFCFALSRGPFLRVQSSHGRFAGAPEWQYMVHRPLEARRGLDPDSDLFSPGFFSLTFHGGDTACLTAEVTEDVDFEKAAGSVDVPAPPSFDTSVPLSAALEDALGAFIVSRGTEKSVIAGYPWFLDWGRDSLIFCRSLIELGRTDDARAILRLFGRFERDGTLPNMIHGEDARNIETSDAPLWFFACCRELIEKEEKMRLLDEDLGGRSIRKVLAAMADAMISGTPTGVKADPDTLLLYSPAHFTWMDTNFPAGTPRQGYPVEIQALWYNALVLMAKIDEAGSRSLWQERAQKVRKGIMDLFWMESKGYFSDCLHADAGTPAADAPADDALRPNQLLLLTLNAVDDPVVAQRTVETCRELLVPGAIRSLADRKLSHPLEIKHGNALLKDPHAPYSGIYAGDEDTQRKPAYHNGTAWTWQFPMFCEAWGQVFGQHGIPAALAWLGSTLPLMRTGAAGFVPEILDGDFPHTPRGCDAQAWGSSEIARVSHKLTRIFR